MLIDRIKNIPKYGVFRGFTWPEDLPDFGRYNLIYGWNGTGKTTLSKLFRAMEAKTAISDGQATVRFDGQDISSVDFDQVTLPVRVFNREFIYESVFPTGGEVAPIFILGKENVEKQKQVEQLKAELVAKQAELGTSRREKSKAESALDKLSIDTAKSIKDLLRSAGTNPYNNYDKGQFRIRAEKMKAAGDRLEHELTTEARNKLLKQLHATPKSKLDSLTYQLPDLKGIESTVASLLSSTVVSAAIESLKDDVDVSSWVHRGLELHQDREVTDCLFCNQKMPKDRLTGLEAHFSTEYEDLLRSLNDEMTSVKEEARLAANLEIPKPAELYDDLSSEFELAADKLRVECNSAKRVLGAFVKGLDDKKKQIFERVALEEAVPTLKDGVVKNVNAVILKHNRACDSFHSRIETARKQLEADLVARNVQEFVKLGDAVRAAKDGITDATGVVERIEGKITQSEREIVDHHRPAEELNEDLRNYLGHAELRMEIKETGYKIMRHDAPAVALSEGETTAIALLYFLRSLGDRSFVLSEGLVVLDDPVSSLDANALFFAFGFIRERTQDARQLIILTHNFTFFRQVRNWFHNLPRQNKKDIKHHPARFFMLNCTCDPNGRRAVIQRLDSLLEKYESEYHYLFACVHRTAKAPPEAYLEHNYMMPNMARRLLETFLAFRQPQLPRDLWKKCKAVQFDEAKKIRILRFLHTHSHNDTIGKPEHDISLLSEARPVLNDLLDMIKTEDEMHFKAMESLLTSADA